MNAIYFLVNADVCNSNDASLFSKGGRTRTNLHYDSSANWLCIVHGIKSKLSLSLSLSLAL